MSLEDLLIDFEKYHKELLFGEHSDQDQFLDRIQYLVVAFSALYYRIPECSSPYYVSLSRAYNSLKHSITLVNKKNEFDRLSLAAFLKSMNYLEQEEERKTILTKCGFPVTAEEEQYKNKLIALLKKNGPFLELRFRFNS